MSPVCLNIEKRGDDHFVLWYEGDLEKTLASESEARDIMRMALLQDGCPEIRLRGLKGDEMINFIHETPPESMEELVDSYRELSAGRKFAIHSWSPSEDGV